MNRPTIILLCLVQLGWTTPGAFAQDPAKTISIGVLAYRGKARCLAQWSATAAYLSREISGHDFRIVPLSLSEMKTAAERGGVDFILTNTGNYVELEARTGISRIATLRTRRPAAAGNVFGAVIFTRADRGDIRSIRDLDGKSFMAVGRNAFGGFQMAWRKLKANGIDPFEDFSELKFSGFPQDRIALAVRRGEVDAGTFRTGVLRAMAAEGRIALSDFRILDPVEHAGFPFPASTRLYPEWPFSKLRGTPQALAQHVVIALLSMPPDAPAARTGNYAGWTVPLDYQPVHQLFRELRIGPYADLGRITLAKIVRQYRPWIVAAVAILLLFLSWTVWIEFLVKRRTRELSTANAELAREIEERHRAEDIAREREQELTRIARMNTMGEMASGLAHELNHPLATIINYANGSIRRLKAGEKDTAKLLDALERMSGQAQHAAEIIRSLRDLVRKEESRRRNVDVNAILDDISGLIATDAQRHSVALNLDLARSLPRIHADVVQVEQVILNLTRNAIDAMGETEGDRRELSIKTRAGAGDAIEVAVRDTGPGIARPMSDAIFDPFISTKRDGLGLGLSISRTIIEAHGGRLWTAASDADGAEFCFSLPAAEQ